MGYNTYYDISIEGEHPYDTVSNKNSELTKAADAITNPQLKQLALEGIKNPFSDMCDSEIVSHILKEIGCDYSNPFDDSCKWYSHEQDMFKVSEKYPNAIFKLSGQGEDAEDIWVKYFKDGKMQTCKAKITFEEYDESKLR